MAAMTVTNTRTSAFGDMKVTMGEFTCTVGDASTTIGVEGGWAMAFFHSQDSSGAYQAIPMRYSLSTSGSVTTITVYTQETVTTGKFLIIHK